jgi:hypothetical protein
MMMMWTSVGLGKVSEDENFNHIVGFYELKQHETWFDEEFSM